MKTDMKKQEIQLIKQLRQDSRKSLANISRDIKIPISTVLKKVKTCEKDLIKRYTCLLNFDKLGFNARIHLAIKVNKEKRKALQQHLSKNMFVNNLSKTNNGYDFFVEAVFKHEIEAEEFIDELKQRFDADIKVYHVISDLQKEMFMVKN